MALPAGYQLKEYRIEDVIGSGGFGITYKALDTQLDKTVAIKEYFHDGLAVRTDVATVRPKSTADQGDYQWGLDRFQDEARTLARFEHPHLNQVHRHFKDNGTAYMVLEYIEGETLSDLLKREGRLKSPRLHRLVTELLSGLEEMHSADYVHRDVKPSNIMLRKNGSSVLLDFGAARQALGQRSKNLTTVYTSYYAPIEQRSGKGGKTGPWSDIYSLGIVAYRCVSGINETELLDAVARYRLKYEGKQDQDMQPAVEVGRGHYPSSLLKAIDWAIKVEEDYRPQNVTAIREMIAGDEVSDNAPDAVPVDKPAKQPIKQPSSPKLERFGKWFGAVAVVLLLVFAWWSEKVEWEETERIVQAERERKDAERERRAAARLAQVERERRETARRAQVERERRETTRRAQIEREQRAVATRRAQAEKKRREEAERVALVERKRREEAARVATAQKCQSYYNNKTYAKALDSCLRAAAQGDVSAQNNLGHMYRIGKGVSQDDTEAVKWYRKAADQGYALGQSNLGYMYRAGKGVAHDYTEAVKWYRKAAEQEYASGQFNLGAMYLEGKGGLRKNTRKARAWFQKAADQGHANSQFSLGLMYLDGRGGLRKNTRKARAWFQKAADQGHANSQFSLGLMYLDGRGGLRKNTRKARAWFQKAAAQGHVDAKKELKKL